MYTQYSIMFIYNTPSVNIFYIKIQQYNAFLVCMG